MIKIIDPEGRPDKTNTFEPRNYIGLTEKEIFVLEKLAEAWNGFVKLESYHQDETPEFRTHIHNAQYIIARRVAARVNPDIWPIIKHD